MATQTPTSSIAMALAGKTASVDIPKPRFGHPSGAHAQRTLHPNMLPTPPNSISPTLAPHGFKRHDINLPASPPLATSQLDSDIDLGDAVDSANTGHRNATAHSLEAAGAITPGMLAKYHLPEILLQHGPLAIRHVMGYLTTSVPGFSGIPPAKARRLVVAALEGRGGDDKGSDAIFEKVGWGRWDARRRGEPSGELRRHELSPPSSVSDNFAQRGMQIPRRESFNPYYGSSVTGGSAVFSYTEMEFGGREDMLEHEADKMSLDGVDRDYCSSSPAPEDDIQDEDWGEEDITDEEDWAQIGADALRARSMNGGGGFVNGRHPPQLHGGGPASSSLAKSAPRGGPIQQLGFSLPDIQERAAVEALLRLGSM
ncbi:Putative Mucin [Aspergillus calidoustus]|uniref:Putative Mucin n=1 Tax=Aspergillus calidoustus TaxID=454130 RepID=A0A0U5GA42_ASPCI|nr:Putative Mucin [Aspergillus calidoustus]